MSPLLPPSRMRQCSAPSRSFLRGPAGPCGGCIWTRPALRRSHRARRTGTETRSAQIKVSTVRGEPRTPDPLLAKYVCHIARDSLAWPIVSSNWEDFRGTSAAVSLHRPPLALGLALGWRWTHPSLRDAARRMARLGQSSRQVKPSRVGTWQVERAVRQVQRMACRVSGRERHPVIGDSFGE